MTENTEILICDDEPVLREMVRDYLGGRGYDIIEADCADALHAKLQDHSPKLILLDINMPGEDGLSALRTLRAMSNIPVIMITAADDVIDRVVGLEMGADDYLGKPIDLRELEARIKAALRRSQPIEPPQIAEATGADNAHDTADFGTCTLDLCRARLLDGEGREIYITAMEFNLLKVFAENRGRVLNRDQLLEQAHDKSWEPFDRSIDLRISLPNDQTCVGFPLPAPGRYRPDTFRPSDNTNPIHLRPKALCCD